MKRELKFRAWDSEEGKMMPVKIIDWKDDLCTVDEGDNTITDHIEMFEIMQQTGIKDINGDVIFEGEIIEVPDDYDTYGFNAGEIYEIFFNAGGFRCKPKLNPKAKGIWLEDDGEFKIIGNIYQNPDLRPS